MNVLIETRPESFKKGKSNLVGIIFIKYGDLSFPDEKWSDFVIVLLNWWLQAIMDGMNTNNYPTNFQLLFMDGPFFVIGQLLSSKDVLLSFRRRGYPDEDIIIKEVIGPSEELIDSLFTSANQALRICHEMNYIDSEVNKLSQLLKQFSQIRYRK